jgi:acyl-coenzyme A synthetase/AMP-(fatty) acid ligase
LSRIAIENKYGKAYDLEMEESLNNCESENPMYICFTSGSTGVPKAVVSPNKSVLQSLNWFIEEFRVTKEDKFINLAGLSHDPLIRELLIPICANATLIIPTADEFSRPAKLRSLIYTNKVTILAHITPSLADIFSSTFDERENKINSIRLVCFAGERLMRNNVVNLLKIMPNSKVENFYGVTEVPQIRSHIEITKDILDEVEGMPAGKGIKDTQLLIMNRVNKLCGVGEIGEVIIRTPYVSYGYLNDKETTDKKFTRDSKNGNIYMYNTGDYGRYMPSGHIQFEGRKDRQVKIRGYRVELDEVEEKLNDMPKVKKAVVKVQKLDSLGDSIVAFFVSSTGESIASKEIKSYVSKCLPSYMVPVGIRQIDSIPVTANGKVNYNALVFDSIVEENIERISPRTEVENLLWDIYSNILNITALGINENFFNIGGNSLIAFQIIAEINRTLYVDLGLKDIFLYPTIEELAKVIEKILLEEDY